MKLDVIPRILDETLRLWAPIPAIGLAPYEDTVIGGRYALPKGPAGHGPDARAAHAPQGVGPADEFDIDRWLPENRSQHHPHAYKPFGNGERACIGRQFALTEARLALALVLQNFAITDPNDYQIKVKETLTRKPENFMVRVRSRQPYERFDIRARGRCRRTQAAAVAVNVVGVTLRVAYGSNLGASEDLARQRGRPGRAVRLRHHRAHAGRTGRQPAQRRACLSWSRRATTARPPTTRSVSTPCSPPAD